MAIAGGRDYRGEGRVCVEALVAFSRGASRFRIEVLGRGLWRRLSAAGAGGVLEHAGFRSDPGLRADRDRGAGDTEPSLQDWQGDDRETVAGARGAACR